MTMVTSNTMIWTLSLRDGTVLRYTMLNRDLVVGGNLFKALIGVMPSSVERNTGMSANNSQVQLLINDAEITLADMRNGRYRGTRVEIARVDWTDPDGAAPEVLLRGHLADLEIAGDRGMFDLNSLEFELSKPLLPVVTLPCTADLGDARCKYPLATQTGSVTAVLTARRVFTDGSRTEADGYFDGGKLTFTRGAANGLVMDVKRYTLSTGQIELYEPLSADIAPSDAFEITRGCDKRLETCRDTFDNLNNYRGFPFVPGYSDLVSGNL